MQFNKELITEIYKHVTYCGTISASIMIYYNTFFMKEFDPILHKQTVSLAFFKSFMLYNSTPIEYVHHLVQLILSCAFYLSLNYEYDDTMLINKAYIITHCILFTPVFNNIKFYVPRNFTQLRTFLDTMTAIFFFYYRSQFSYFWLSNDGNKILKMMFGRYSIIFNFFVYILTGMNIFWSYKIISIVKYKFNKTLVQTDKKRS